MCYIYIPEQLHMVQHTCDFVQYVYLIDTLAPCRETHTHIDTHSHKYTLSDKPALS